MNHIAIKAGGHGVTHEDIMLQLRATDKRLEDGDHRFLSMENTLKAIGSALNDLHEGQTAIRKDIEPVIDDISIIKDVIGASKAIQTGTRFLKWVGAISGAVAAIIVAIKVSAAAFARAFP